MNPATALSKGAATRELILSRALEIADARGIDALTIGTLADAAGMSKSGVFAHFGSREELQLAVLDAAARGFTDEVFVPAVRERRGLPRLRAILEARAIGRRQRARIEHDLDALGRRGRAGTCRGGDARQDGRADQQCGGRESEGNVRATNHRGQLLRLVDRT